MRRRALLAVPLLALSVHALPFDTWGQRVQIPTQWYGVEVEDNIFTVQMPGVPDHRIVSDVTSRGTNFQLHSYSLEAEGFSYVAQSAIYPGDVKADAHTILQSALDGRATGLVDGKWSQVDWRQLQGVAAVESTGTVKGGNVLRQLVLLKGHSFVSLAFLGPAGSATSPQAERFFTSLKLS
jgi:hypothetical protein